VLFARGPGRPEGAIRISPTGTRIQITGSWKEPVKGDFTKGMGQIWKVIVYSQRGVADAAKLGAKKKFRDDCGVC